MGGSGDSEDALVHPHNAGIFIFKSVALLMHCEDCLIGERNFENRSRSSRITRVISRRNEYIIV